MFPQFQVLKPKTFLSYLVTWSNYMLWATEWYNKRYASVKNKTSHVSISAQLSRFIYVNQIRWADSVKRDVLLTSIHIVHHALIMKKFRPNGFWNSWCGSEACVDNHNRKWSIIATLWRFLKILRTHGRYEPNVDQSLRLRSDLNSGSTPGFQDSKSFMYKSPLLKFLF